MGYINSTDFANFGIPADALDTITVDPFIDQGSGLIDSYLRGRYTVPLSNPPDEIKRANAIISVYDAISYRGYDPENPQDVLYRIRYEDVIKWLELIAKGTISLDGGSDNTPEEDPATPYIETSEARGW